MPNLTYKPTANYHGNDSFTFQVNDGNLNSSVATVSITVNPVPDTPQAQGLSGANKVVVVQNMGKQITLPATDADDDALAYTILTKPSHGTLTGSGATRTYTPATDFPSPSMEGNDSFTYQVIDTSDRESEIAQVDLRIVINPPPNTVTFSPTELSVEEEGSVEIALSAADEKHPAPDFKPQWDAIDHFRIVEMPSHGTIVGVDLNNKITANNTGVDGSQKVGTAKVEYHPTQDYPNASTAATDTFRFVANDGSSDSESVTITVTVLPVDDAPVAHDQQVDVVEDSISNTITLAGSDIDGDDNLAYSIVTQPSNGTLSVVSESKVTYTPEANFPHTNAEIGIDTFTFKITDSTNLDSNISTVTLTVTPINDVPVSTSPPILTTVQSSVNNPILMTATDADNDPLTFIIMSDVTNGTISKVVDNGVMYTPTSSFSGSDSFTFKTNDGHVDSNVSTVNINIKSVKEEVIEDPSAGQTEEIHTESGTIEIELPPASDPSIAKVAVGIAKSNFNEISSASTEAAKETAAIAIISQLKNNVSGLRAVVSGSKAEQKIKEHLKRASGTMLTIEVKKGDGSKKTNFNAKPLEITIPKSGNSSAIALANASGSELIPTRIAGGNLIGTVRHLSLVFTVANTVPNAKNKSISLKEDESVSITLTGTDANNDPLTYMILGSPSKGSLSGSGDKLTYTPYNNQNGSDSFTYIANDGAINSAPATISISIIAINDAPLADKQTVFTKEDKSLAITLSGSDPDGDVLIYKIIDQPTSGILSGIVPNLTYTPKANYSGTDSFTFNINDGTTYSQNEIVTINVSNINDVPTLSFIGNISLGEDADDQIIELSASDSDGDVLTYTITNSNADLVTTIIHGNKLTLDLQPNQNGSSAITVTVNDSNGSSSNQTFSLEVSAVDDAPVASSASLETIEDQQLAISLVATDVDREPLTYNLVDTPTYGELSIITDGQLTYTPIADYHGVDSFTFQASDGKLLSETATIDITITPVNDLPIAINQNGEKRVEFTDLTAEILLSGKDVDGDTLSYVIVNPPHLGQLSGKMPSLTYTPRTDFTSIDQFTFKVNDGTSDSQEATVEIVRPFLPFEFEVPIGISLIHLPLRVKFVNEQSREIGTVGDLYDALGENNVNFLITYHKKENSWVSYLGQENQGSRSDQPITPDLGIVAVMKQAVILDLLGDPLLVGNKAEIQLQRGLNLIGVPIKDERITNASDLFSLPGFSDNVTTIIVPTGGTFKVLARVGDPGDFTLNGSEGIIVTSKADVVISLTGIGWSLVDTETPIIVAPNITTPTGGTTPVLATSGRLTVKGKGFHPNKTHIWIRNLNTGHSQSQVLTGENYQLTLVNIDADGVAKIGDFIEIGGEIGQEQFRIQPHQHQLTEQDIRRSWVQFPNLIVREIPATTRLLPNYPNPFNPDTWIPFELADKDQDKPLTITIFDVIGNPIRTLHLEALKAGRYLQPGHSVYWDGKTDIGETVSSGVYFYTLQVGNYYHFRQMVVLK